MVVRCGRLRDSDEQCSPLQSAPMFKIKYPGPFEPGYGLQIAYLQLSSTATATETVMPTMGEQCEALRVEIHATCQWQVATIPMGATEVTISYFRDSSTATATETVIPTMGLLPAPRKPIISTSNPPVGGFVPAAWGLLEQEARLFAKQEAHHLKAVCCAFLPWGHLITSCVHETRCFDLIKHL